MIVSSAWLKSGRPVDFKSRLSDKVYLLVFKYLAVNELIQTYTIYMSNSQILLLQ